MSRRRYRVLIVLSLAEALLAIGGLAWFLREWRTPTIEIKEPEMYSSVEAFVHSLGLTDEEVSKANPGLWSLALDRAKAESRAERVEWATRLAKHEAISKAINCGIWLMISIAMAVYLGRRARRLTGETVKTTSTQPSHQPT
jgi:hypothetical protein